MNSLISCAGLSVIILQCLLDDREDFDSFKYVVCATPLALLAPPPGNHDLTTLEQCDWSSFSF